MKMSDTSKIDYSALDVPAVLQILFYPRPDFGPPDGSGRGLDVMIPVDDGLRISARFHLVDKHGPNILFFHGNGEIAADYDDLAMPFNELAVNFLPVDYRGYGRSGGRPTITSMMRDCHFIFFFVRDWLAQEGYTGPLIVMGRSLGSASALELADHYSTVIDALVIESGFAQVGPLFSLLGFRGDTSKDPFDHTRKIKSFPKPTLIIHAEFDHIVPFSNGLALYEASPAQDKTLLKISGANHNDIFFVGMSEYMAAIGTLAKKLRESD
jgi:fermentation-respiration switch protein FrsA (DUF1100 family)